MRVFTKKGKLEIERLFLKMVVARPDFFRIGVTEAILKMGGKTPLGRNILNKLVR